ncbi:hypothetical protein AGLY_012141 [Aphis glycines]|uniref:Uncharacterized protein n=1 Tax=Aphis glycines TaxID=307491 RepID=A0A6G0T9E2_APHGL|nr:hypothetical protein AGLY_012141 [Aphis glycines]
MHGDYFVFDNYWLDDKYLGLLLKIYISKMITVKGFAVLIMLARKKSVGGKKILWSKFERFDHNNNPLPLPLDGVVFFSCAHRLPTVYNRHSCVRSVFPKRFNSEVQRLNIIVQHIMTFLKQSIRQKCLQRIVLLIHCNNYSMVISLSLIPENKLFRKNGSNRFIIKSTVAAFLK